MFCHANWRGRSRSALVWLTKYFTPTADGFVPQNRGTNYRSAHFVETGFQSGRARSYPFARSAAKLRVGLLRIHPKGWKCGEQSLPGH